MKKVTLVLAFLLIGNLSANAARILESIKGSIAEYRGHVALINHDNSTLDFYKLETGAAEDASSNNAGYALVMVASLPILDEEGEVITDIEAIEPFNVIRQSSAELSASEGVNINVNEDDIVEESEELLTAIVRTRVGKGKNKQTVLKTAVLKPTLDESGNIVALTTLQVLELGDQAIVRF